MSRVIQGTLASDPQGVGNKVVLGLSDGQRYDLRRFSDLSPNALAFTISSANLSHVSTSDSEASLYLFSGLSPTDSGDYRLQIPQFLFLQRLQFPFLDFHGNFLRLTSPGGLPGSFQFDDLKLAEFNDATASAFLVSRWSRGSQEQTVSAANTFTAPWNLAFMGIIPVVQFLLGGGVAIARIQDPVFSWLAFPPAHQTLPTNYTYLTVSQWFVFNAWGIGINAWLMFYFRLGLDANGKLELNVVEMDFFVWPGTGQGNLISALNGSKNGIISALQAASSLIFPNLTGTVCDEVYLLPGTQPNQRASANASAKGSALQDVTIVLVNPRH